MSKDKDTKKSEDFVEKTTSEEKKEVKKTQTRQGTSGRRPQQSRRPKVESHVWEPKTQLGKKVKDGQITDIAEILEEGTMILEPEIVDYLLTNNESDLLLIGQSKGKFGGGARRVFKQTQKKTREGNKPQFATCAIIGNKDGYVGLGYGKAKETVPAREKAIKSAKLNLIQIRRGCGSWDCNCSNPHSIPFKVNAKVGSVEITLMPAPVGKGLIIEKECKKMLELAGIKDVWSRTKGMTKTKINLILACFKALKQLTEVKIDDKLYVKNNVIAGKVVEKKEDIEFMEELEKKATVVSE
jgi:small subunit ribosomal protein S5